MREVLAIPGLESLYLVTHDVDLALTHADRILLFREGEVVADGYPVSISLWADGVLRHSKDVVDGKPFRMKSGYYGQEWVCQVASQHPVQSVTFAHSIEELAST